MLCMIVIWQLTLRQMKHNIKGMVGEIKTHPRFPDYDICALVQRDRGTVGRDCKINKIEDIKQRKVIYNI